MPRFSVSAPELVRIADVLVTIASMYASTMQRRRLTGWLHSPVVIRDAFKWAVARVDENFDDNGLLILALMSTDVSAREVPVDHAGWSGPFATLYCDIARDSEDLDESDLPGDAIQFRVQIFFTQKRIYIGRYEIFMVRSCVSVVLGTAGPMCDFTLAATDCRVVLRPGFGDANADLDVTAVYTGLAATGAVIPPLAVFVRTLRLALDAR